MIIIHIWEGLGNQLFQYAYARALQLRNNEDVRLCALPLQDENRTFREYELNKFAISIPRDVRYERLLMSLVNNKRIKGFLKWLSKLPFTMNYFEEKSVQYDEQLKFLKGNYFLHGWFQNEKYFKEYEDVIRREIRLKKRIKISKKLRYIFAKENTVSVHFRRGDFRKCNNLLSMGYYQSAFSLISEQVETPFYIVFSDDIHWAKEHLQFRDNVYYMDEEEKLEDYEELFIMSKCKHNIIANSTFSWWGAWLNTNPDKIVIGPKRWFAKSKLNIMPDAWIKL